MHSVASITAEALECLISAHRKWNPFVRNLKIYVPIKGWSIESSLLFTTAVLNPVLLFFLSILSNYVDRAIYQPETVLKQFLSLIDENLITDEAMPKKATAYSAHTSHSTNGLETKEDRISSHENLDTRNGGSSNNIDTFLIRVRSCLAQLVSNF